MDPDPHRSTLCDHIACRGEWADVQWHPDGSRLAFVSSSRDHKQATLRIADAATGQVRTVLDEKVDTFFESGNGRVNWKYLPASNEIIWFSQRDNWGQLYLYDAQSGALKHAITTGEGNVTQVLRVDERKRELYFLGMGREKGGDPYFRHFYRIGMDGKGLRRLTPEDADHDITLSPSGRYLRRQLFDRVAAARGRPARRGRQAAAGARKSRRLEARWRPAGTLPRRSASKGVTESHSSMG